MQKTTNSVSYIVFFFCSAVEQPDVVFSVEQIRCGQLPKAEPNSPALAPENCGTSDFSDSDPDSEHLSSSSQTEDEDLNPSSTAEIFNKLKEKPEELLLLAPAAGDGIVPLIGGETNQNHSIYFKHQ